jgi:hypothetical protein
VTLQDDGPAFDATVPNAARIYDYLLGGKDNYATDRDAADRLLAVLPRVAQACQDNRQFLQRAVRYLTAAGVRQFIDIGSGLPTAGNVHEIAREADPGARVAYVDYDRTVLAVMHAEETPDGRVAVLDRIDRWQGSKGAPVDLAEVRDTLIDRAREYRADVVADPHQAILIAQEARQAGVTVHEFAFTAASVGRLALALHQALRNHRIMLPDDDMLTDELTSARLRKNTLGVYRLDHDAGRHDDQAIALALGVHWLAEAGVSAEQWINWARQKAQQAQAAAAGAGEASRNALRFFSRAPQQATTAQEPSAEVPMGDDAARRKAARDAAYRAHHAREFAVHDR